MPVSLVSRRALCALAAAVALAAEGCASQATQWMISLRTSQGDAALASGNLQEAEKEYALALQLAPKNERARQGLARVLFLHAKAEFVSSKLDDAQYDIARAREYNPDDAATKALAAQIDEARIRRDVVVANYPLYGTMGLAIRDSLKSISSTVREVEKNVHAFSNDFDTANLTRAITESYDLEDEVHRVVLRLIAYRGLVESGGQRQKAPEQSEAPNLLPIP